MAAEDEFVDVLVVGAGPTGLGAASRLLMHGSASWLLVEASDEPGGLACTAQLDEGFLFDMGGHVIFSHYDYFDQLCEAAIGSGPESWCLHERVSYVRCRGSWVPYPFQNNLCALPVDERVTCLRGLVEAAIVDAAKPSTAAPPRTFDEWIVRRLGVGIADVFMRPYNLKVWGCPTTEMQCRWLGERVAAADAPLAVENAVRGRVAAGWGPNATFRFPAKGGTGAIWRGVASLLPASRLRLGVGVSRVDLAARRATLSDGSTVRYGSMLSTMPLDELVEATTGDEELHKAAAAGGLRYSSSHIIGFGFRGTHTHGKRCWLYFPEDNCPFYRATIFSSYAPEGNVPPADKTLPGLCMAGDVTAAMKDAAKAQSHLPDEADPHATSSSSSSSSSSSDGGSGQSRTAVGGGVHSTAPKGDRTGPYWSIMLEVTESAHLPRPSARQTVSLGGKEVPLLLLEALQGCINTGLVPADTEVVACFHRRLERGYPTPSLHRDEALAALLPRLRDKHRVWSRGRFGGWKYEVANQDHSTMQGVEAVDNILFGSAELTLNHPDLVNRSGGRNTQLRFELPAASTAAAAATTVSTTKTTGK